MPSRRSNGQLRALRLSRKLCPDAILFAGKVLKDEGEDTSRRLKAAEIILLHGMPKGDISKFFSDDMVSNVTITIQRGGGSHAESDSVTIEATPEPGQLVITTVPAGHGNDD